MADNTSIVIGDKVFRTLEAQVYRNTKLLEQLLQNPPDVPENSSTVNIGGRIYRSLEAQVYWNTKRLEAVEPKTSGMTVSVGVDDDGKLWTTPSDGPGSDLDPVEKTSGMTQSVGRDASGKLWTTPPVDYSAPITYLQENKQDKVIARTVDIETSDWNAYNEAEMTVSGVTESNILIVAPDPTDVGRWADNNIVCYFQNTNTLWFHCDTVPDQTITVFVLIFN